MLTIRLSRIGRKKKPMYRLVISEKSQTPKGRALEYLGSYNPYTKILDAKKDRIEYWLSKGAGMSNTVNNLLISKLIIKGKKIKVAKCEKKNNDNNLDQNKDVNKNGGDDKKAEEDISVEKKKDVVINTEDKANSIQNNMKENIKTEVDEKNKPETESKKIEDDVKAGVSNQDKDVTKDENKKEENC